MFVEYVFLASAITWAAISWIGFNYRGMGWPKRTGFDSIENIPEQGPPKVSIRSDDTPFHFEGSVTQKAEQILAWCQNNVGKVGPGRPNMASALRKTPEEVSGICGDMALFFREALTLAGIQSRQVNLHRDVVEPSDGHVIVEVLNENGWVAYDPTFGLKYQLNGSQASAQAIHEHLRANGGKIEFCELGEDTLYPADIEDYYIGLPLLFNHVYYPYQKNKWPSIIKGRHLMPFVKNKILHRADQQLAYVVDHPLWHQSKKYTNKKRTSIMTSRLLSLAAMAVALYVLLDTLLIP